MSPDGARVIVQRVGYTGPETRDSSLVLVPAVGGAETVVPASSGLPVTRTGTVVVRTTSAKGVYVDGMAVLH